MSNHHSLTLAEARRRLGDVSIKHAELAWNPGTDQILVVPYPEEPEWFGDFRLSYTAGAVFGYWEGLKKHERQLALLTEAMRIIVIGACPPGAVHTALLVVPEYRELFGGDVPKAPRS